MSVGNRYRTRIREIFFGLMQDIRFAMRQIRRAPFFAAVAVFTLAIVILGYGLWQRRFGGRVDALAQPIVVDDTARRIDGIARPASPFR